MLPLKEFSLRKPWMQKSHQQKNKEAEQALLSLLLTNTAHIVYIAGKDKILYLWLATYVVRMMQEWSNKESKIKINIRKVLTGYLL